MKRDIETIERFPVKTTPIPSKPGCWNKLLVEIFEKTPGSDPVKIGEYRRNYASLFDTFLPFKKNGKYYALYSPSYTATRVMSLPDCKDLGGEEPTGFGFCPTGYAVPFGEYVHQPFDPSDPRPPVANHQADKWATIVDRRHWWPDDKNGPDYSPEREAEYLAEKKRTHQLVSEWNDRHPYVTTAFNAEFGFVCGCVWGDDSSWKIQHLDLSQVEMGIVKRDDRYGYVELLGGSGTLADAIDIEYWEPEDPQIYIAVRQSFDMRKRAGESKR